MATMSFKHATIGFLVALCIAWPEVCAKTYHENASNVIHPKPSSRDIYLVEGLADAVPVFGTFDGRMYAGLIPTRPWGEPADGLLMFWLFVPSHQHDALTMWMNGGPGCSSMGGALFENSPVTIQAQAAGFFGIDPATPLVPNPTSWTHVTSMLYLEHPHGTGFSSGPFPHNESEVSRDVYYFMQNFYDLFGSEFARKELFIFGESYAGMYVPSIAHYMHHENQKNNSALKLPLAGIGLGNGWIDATVQGPAVIDYAWWHGMIDSSTKTAMHNEWQNCKDGSPQPSPFHAFSVPDECNIMGAVLEAAGAGAITWGAPNGYDVTTWDFYEMLDARHGALAEFYNNRTVQDILHAPHVEWAECMPGAGRRRRRLEEEKLPGQMLLAQDRPISVVPYIADLLDDADIRVLVYNGDRDLTTCAQGSEVLLDSMDWSGAEAWHNTSQFERGLWITASEVLGGYVKTVRNLSFVVVLNSGHLVPFNRPDVALDLIRRFVVNETFVDKQLPKFDVKVKKHGSYDMNNLPASGNDDDFKDDDDGATGNGTTSQAICLCVAGFLAGIFVSVSWSTCGRHARRSEYEMLSSSNGDASHYQA